MVVLFEDSAAMVGLFVAAAGISLAHMTQLPVFDAAASIFIGVILLVLALFLARETKNLLIGESAGIKDRENIRSVILQCARNQNMRPAPYHAHGAGRYPRQYGSRVYR